MLSLFTYPNSCCSSARWSPMLPALWTCETTSVQLRAVLEYQGTPLVIGKPKHHDIQED